MTETRHDHSTVHPPRPCRRHRCANYRRKGGIRHQGGFYLAVPKLSTIETSGVIDDSELLCHEQLVALDNFLDHFAFRIEPEIG
jgi:hypothetical protein